MTAHGRIPDGKNGSTAHADPDANQLPPHSLSAEKALLGSMLRNPSIIAEAIGENQAGSFYTFGHIAIFNVMKDLHGANEPVDVVTVAQRLQDAKLMEDAGGALYLAELLDAAPSAGNFRQYGKIIAEQAQRRAAIQLAEEIRVRANDPSVAPAELLADSQRRFLEISEPGATVGYRFAAIGSQAFAAADYRPSWLIKRLLVKNQPCIVGGPKKALKTSLLIDLALSLGSGSPFLGEFTVYGKIRTVVISGESGPHTIQETARRVAAAKGIDLATTSVLWDFRLPQLASAIELAALGRGLRDVGAEVCIIDPLYLALLGGQGSQGMQASNLYDMGPLLLRVADACLNAGATPVLVHHARKGQGNDFRPIDLDDLAFAGVAEFARQWLLVSRRRAFEPGTGLHEIWLRAGGSIGHGGDWAIDINEGTLGDNFDGRIWEAKIVTAGESRQSDRDQKDERKAQAQKERDRADDASLLIVLDRVDPERKGYGYTQIRDLARLRSERMIRAVQRLIDEGIIEDVPGFTVQSGSCGKKASRGLRRTRQDERDNHQDGFLS